MSSNYKRTSLLLLISVLNHVYASSSANTKSYCEPNDLTKYNPTPTEIVAPSLEKFEDAIESGIIKGGAADTKTLELNDSPYNMFALTIEEATRTARKANEKNSDKMMNTSSVIGTSITHQTIVYDVMDIVSDIIENIMSPVNSAPQSNGELSSPGIASTSDNNSTAKQNSTNSQNTSKLAGQISYNDIITDFLGGTDPTIAQFTNGSKDISQLAINTAGYKLLADGCSDTIPSSESTTTTTSSSTSTDTSSQLSGPPANGSGGSSGGSNMIKKSLKACSAAIGASILNSTQKTLVPQIYTYLDGFISSTSNDTKNYVDLYNDTLEKVNKIADEDLSAYGTSTGMNFPANFLQATCSGSSCPSASDVQTELNTVSSMLDDVAKNLNKMLYLKINILIAANESTKTSTDNNYKDQKYFVNMGTTLGDIINLNSFGVPNTESPLHCSTKSKYLSASLTAIANDLIDKVDQTTPPPAYMTRSLPFTSNSIAVGGAFNTVLNQNNISDYATNQNLIWTARKTAKNSLTILQVTYNNYVKSFIAQKSLALQNLREIVEKRSELHQVPLIYNTLDLNHKCKNGLNSQTSESDCQFQDPFSNITTDWNLEDKQICSLKELEYMEANWRQLPGPNNSINPWQQQLKYSSSTEVQRAKLLLLAEIKEQIYLNKKLHDRILAANSASLITSLTDNKKAMNNLLDNINSAMKSFITGGGS
ncbi:MAG: hypothetical protein HON55_05370 [Legionellales bacterium]|nr:hypothetical protein [Legionellales bacterium]